MSEPMQEDDFRIALGQDTIDVPPLLEALNAFHKEDAGKSTKLANRLREKLAEAGRKDDIVDLMETVSRWHERDRGWKKNALDSLLELFSDDADRTLMAKSVGFEERKVKSSECFRRLKTMMSFKEEALVYDKNWGFGIIQDLLYQDGKLCIDFAKKPGHMLALSFAGEALQLIDENHLMARKNLDAEAFQELVDTDPAEVVRITLRSFGPRSAPLLQEIIVPEIVPEDRWKRFWDAARKKLKEDRLVIIPAKRNDDIRLLEKQTEYDDDWFATLANERDMHQVINLLQECLEEKKAGDFSEGHRDICVNRLNFVIKGAEGKHFDLTIRAILLAKALGIEYEAIGVGEFMQKMFDRDYYLSFTGELPAKDFKGLLNLLPEINEDEAIQLYLSVLPDLDYPALDDTVTLLCKHDKETEVAQVLRKPWNAWEAGIDVVYYLAVNMDKMKKWEIGRVHDLTSRMLKVMLSDYTGDKLTIRNRMRDLFRQDKWLQEVIPELDTRQRRTLTQGVKDSPAWETLDKNSALARLAKMCPEVEDIVAGKSEDKPAARPRLMVTSRRMYAHRELELKRISDKDLPEVRVEIQRAREHGDLRENFEFKAAKERQTVLMARQGELQQMLQQVKPVAFEKPAGDAVSVGSSVRIRYPDEHEETYHILGEWDGHPEMHVLSCSSGLAENLLGAKVDEDVDVPTESGDLVCKVVGVETLPDEIQVWANDISAPPAPGGIPGDATEEEAAASEPPETSGGDGGAAS